MAERKRAKELRLRKKPKELSKAVLKGRALKRKMKAEKAKIKGAENRLAKLEGRTDEALQVTDELKAIFKNAVIQEPESKEAKKVVEEKREVIFKPNDGPQTEFLAASELEILYGGAAGGGKSYGLIADPMRYFDRKNFSGILFRRTNDELREIKWKTKELYPKVFPDAKWSDK